MNAIHAGLKRLIAGRELDALERYRVNCEEASRFLHAFPAARDAIAYVRAMGEGTACPPITTMRAAIDVDEQARLLCLAVAIRGNQTRTPLSPALQRALDDLGRHVEGWR